MLTATVPRAGCLPPKRGELKLMSVVKLHITATGMSGNRATDPPPPPLPISKLRGVPSVLRVRLKRLGITNCDQLLVAAGREAARQALAEAASVDLGALDQAA